MKLMYVTQGPLSVNTYFLINTDKNTAVVIDSGENYKLVKKIEKENGFKITAVLLTHAHFDHAGNAKAMQDDGAEIIVSKIDAEKLAKGQTLATAFGRQENQLIADRTFDDGDLLELEGIKIKALLTPGHTDGSACFIVDDMLFSGDTLFYETVGRTDFPTGDREQLINSVKRLFDLKGEYRVFPGHQEFTTLSHEREHNFFVDYD